MKIHQYNLIVIGSGSAGFSAATTAKENGLEKILLIEKRRVGYSLCTNEGCMPSKTLLASAEVKRIIEESTDFGIASTQPNVNWDAVQKRVRTLVEDDFFAARRDAIRNAPVDLVEGNARFTSPHTIQVGDNTYTADRIVIATGSVVSVPPFPGLRETGYLDSDGALYLEKLPGSLIVLGGGYIAIELGYLFHKMGVDVTIVQRSERILSSLDADISSELERILRRGGMKILTGVDVESVDRSSGNKRVHAAIREGGQTTLEAEEIMIATGRDPAIGGLNLEQFGVQLDEYGAIQVNDFLQTSVPHIYAVGDVNGKMPLVYVASMEGRVAGLHAAGVNGEKIDYRLVSNIIFSHPEIGTVGLTAQEAEANGLNVVTAKTPMEDIGKAVAIGQTDGFIKLVAERPSGKIVGLHVIGPHATDIMQVALPHIYHNDTVFDVLNIPYPHPTLGEALSYAAEEVAACL
ncbi:MAG: NAD(P)/FAD-dependent oxidoreductase [Candidatus Poribacteria bacterium]|nr:NAD(P)/FAD-dependent oxidoreductase [Candidatus Poribacteria bacterium]